MNKTHSEPLFVQPQDCDSSGRMRLDALFFAMQEGGERHAVQLGLGYDAMMARGLFFALTRVHVAVERLPRQGETLVHTTWPGTSNRFFCPRFHRFTLEDGTPLLSVGALWAMLDVNSRTIVSPLKAELGFPDTADIPPATALPTRLPAISQSGTVRLHTPQEDEFDVNGHINNTKYIAWLCRAIDQQVSPGAFVSDLVAGYEKEIRSRDPLSLCFTHEEPRSSFTVSSASGEKHFVASVTLKSEVSP